MKVLVLGGTGFLGPEIVESLIARKHTVTLFNRGKSHPTLFPDVEKLIGDRNSDLKALENRSWDVVIDVPASLPSWVIKTTELLKKNVKRYVFVSTISVFNDFAKAGINEDGPKFEAPESLDTETKITNELYGPLKLRCEDIVNKAYASNATIVRPGLIVGPNDPTDRFTYWPVRVDKGGDILAPGDGSSLVQFVDARDLGEFIAKLIDDGHNGIYNATGPASPLRFDEFLYGCRAATSSKMKFVWADEKFLLDNQVGPFMEMTMWVPGDDMAGFMKVDCSKAISHGLTFRPVSQTACDTMDWVKTRPDTYKWQAGLLADKEQALLTKWKAHSTTRPAK